MAWHCDAATALFADPHGEVRQVGFIPTLFPELPNELSIERDLSMLCQLPSAHGAVFRDVLSGPPTGRGWVGPAGGGTFLGFGGISFLPIVCCSLHFEAQYEKNL